MPHYVISPDQKELPTGPHLMEKLHHLGFPVEINVKGSAQNWNEINFYEPGPPEVECLLSFGEKDGNLRVSVSNDAPLEARELKIFLVDLLLKELGGQADNTETRERYTAEEFAKKIKSHYGLNREVQDLIWIIFSSAVVATAIAACFFSPQNRGLVSVVVILSFLSATGLTYSHYKP